MSIPQKSLFSLLSWCQKFLQSVEIWQSSDKKYVCTVFLRHGVEWCAYQTLKEFRRSVVLIQIARVTDGQTYTDRRTDGTGVAYTRYSIMPLSRVGHKNCKIIFVRTLSNFHQI